MKTGAGQTPRFFSSLRSVLGSAVITMLTACAQFQPASDLPVGPDRTHDGGVTACMVHSETSGLSYVITTPPRSERDEPDTLSPMIVFLHSLEERGRRLAPLFDNPDGQGVGIAGFAVGDPDFPFVTVSPLCPARTYWFFLHNRLDVLIDEVIEKYPVDPRRVYLMGVSMGGMGVWSFAMASPSRIAAAAPIAGGVYSPPMRRRYRDMKDVPVWAFHAQNDPSIPIDKNERAVSALNAVGGTARISRIESDRHYIQDEIFSSGEVFTWFLENAKHRE